ncbi:MAG: flagellar basal body-associated FliL family protein [Deltaproteobacteria bacterium]|nr:flagellar basal body-associated FliL family protein [Deltaproteobacteria bacterium]
MADEEVKEQNSASPEKKKGKAKLIIIPAVLLLLMGGAAGGAKMGLLPIPGLAPKKGEQEREQQAASKKPEPAMGVIYPMKPFIVNLADESGDRYLKVKFELELDSKELVPEIEQRMPQLTDAVIMLLSSRSYKDLASYEGKDRVRNELILRLNSFLVTGSIKRIFFTEFVMQ